MAGRRERGLEETPHLLVAGDLASPAGRERLRTRLHDAGQRVTPQRVTILAALEAGAHLSADEIYARVEQVMPAVTRSTVYRTLESFRDAGLVSETDLGNGVRQFEPMAGSRHHHLVCQDCGAMLVLDDDLVEPLRQAIAARYGFQAWVDHLALFGRCRACAGTAASAPRPTD